LCANLVTMGITAIGIYSYQYYKYKKQQEYYKKIYGESLTFLMQGMVSYMKLSNHPETNDYKTVMENYQPFKDNLMPWIFTDNIVKFIDSLIVKAQTEQQIQLEQNIKNEQTNFKNQLFQLNKYPIYKQAEMEEQDFVCKPMYTEAIYNETCPYSNLSMNKCKRKSKHIQTSSMSLDDSLSNDSILESPKSTYKAKKIKKQNLNQNILNELNVSI